MSGIKWTADQQKIIAMRGCNILVSAAAGSGKTAVLVERIFQRIMDERDPVNVDQFVVVTFTNAAAAQMKDRLRSRFERALEEQPENRHLQRQIGLLASAHISTVHSFCHFVIQNYFHRIGLDPSFRQGTKVEVELLKSEVWKQILEQEYEEGREDFTDLADMSEWNRQDDGIGEMVFSIYETMMAQPFPLDFLKRMAGFLQTGTEAEWENTQFVHWLLTFARGVVNELHTEQQELLRLCRESGWPPYYEPHLQELGGILQQLLAAETYDAWYQVLCGLSFKRMNKRKDDTVEEEKRKEMVERCKVCKDRLRQLAKECFPSARKENLQDMKEMRGKVLTLLRLAERLHEAFVEEKRNRNLVDFHDLEQLALSILLQWEEEKGAYVRTDAAVELAGEFVEIMIDEYQDSNLVQDTLLHAVSRDGLPGERPNIFMVGDAKQSIYRFRGGCPELFAGKLERYGTKEGDLCRRLDLHQNFRSREVVLEGSNRVFERVMHRDIGGVEYDRDARLRPGLTFPETELPVAEKIDVYAVLGSQSPEAEGYLMARKIEEMVRGEAPLYVWEGETYRRVMYRDIVVLIQAHKQGQEYFDALSEAGIPVVMEHTQGFFETREIQLMVAMLQVIDNPHQDIPLAAVLLGPMFSFTEEELSRVRVENRGSDLYDALCSYDKADGLYEQVQSFLEVLERLRRKVTYATVAELVQDIYDETGIYESVMMMRDGVQRNANMDSLMEQAREFDGTTYHGLYQFVRYLERVAEQTEEMGEVNLSGEEENVVRIMTIHKSKGLEFPVCIVGGMGRRLHLPHKDFLSICPDMGIAAPIVDNTRRTKKKNLYTVTLNLRNHLEDTGENMRKLYVAMTRAKEKLILIGCANNTDCRGLDYAGREKINTFFDMVLPAVHREPRYFTLEEVEQEELLQQMEQDLLREEWDFSSLYNFDTSTCYDKNLGDILQWMESEEQDWHEPLPVKVSVSDLKVRSMEDSELGDFTILTHEEEEEEMPVPAFMQDDKGGTDAARQGAAYGTIWHQVMATISFARTATADEIRREIECLVETGRLRRKETKVLNIDRLAAFFSSPLGTAMRQADARGQLHREQPFVMGRRACEIFADRTEEDTVLVQGIIDSYYETDEGIVLIDYKTDSLQPGQEQKLVDRYRTQMELYREALEGMTGKKVTRCVLYAFSLGTAIDLL